MMARRRQRIRIELDNSEKCYVGGDTLTGRVILELEKSLNTSGISLTITGRGKVTLDKQKTNEIPRKASVEHGDVKLKNLYLNTNTTITINDEEIYFQNTMNIYNPGSVQLLRQGNYSFPFTFVLPVHIPSSFEGEFGHLRYMLRAVLKATQSLHSNVAIEVFNVLCPLDLNADLTLAKPVRYVDENTFCYCLCCTAGLLEVTLSLPTRGFVPGENLVPVVQVHNASNVNIELVYLSLVKMVTFRGKKQRKETKEEIIKLPLGSVKENDHQLWSKSIITIPESVSPQLKYCNIIDIQYYVQVVLSPSGMHYNTELNVPIVMGTIPFTHQDI